MKSIEEINKEYVEAFESLMYVREQDIFFHSQEVRESFITILAERVSTLAWVLGKDLVKV